MQTTAAVGTAWWSGEEGSWDVKQLLGRIHIVTVYIAIGHAQGMALAMLEFNTERC